MVRIGQVVVAGLLLGALFAPSTAVAAGPVIIRDVGAGEYPEVAVTVSVAGGTSADDLAVTEDGEAISDVEVTPLGESTTGVDVVLVVDTSGSIEDALASAISAAKSFVAKLPDDARIGVVSFSGNFQIERRLTLDRAGVVASLESLGANGETALYDGVDAALGLFSGDNQRNIVLLSDGGDTTSTTTLSRVSSAASAEETAIHSIALRTPETDRDALRSLARSSGGTYSSAATADLAGVYKDIASALSQQFLVTYATEAAGGSEIEIEVSTAAGADVASVDIASNVVAAAPSKGPADTDSPAPIEFGATWTLFLALALTFAAVFFIAYLLLVRRYRSVRERRLARLAAVASTSVSTRADAERTAASLIPESLVIRAEKIAEQRGFSVALRIKLDRAGTSLRTGEFAAGSALLVLAGYFVGTLLLGSLWIGMVLGIVGGVVPLVVLNTKIARRSKRMHAQLTDVLSILASSLRAGHSFLQSLDLVAQEIGEPSSEEYRRLLAELRLGRELNESLDAMTLRIGSDDFKWAIIAVKIQREVGGNLAEILDTVATTLREREAVRGQVKALSAEGRLSMYLLCGLPFAVAIYMMLVNPEYLSLLWTTKMGLVMLAVGGSLMALGIIWMRKVVRIDV
jgi:tight adherence protein B